MTDELLEELDRANRGEAPSPFGKAEFIVKGSPASVQASKDKRDQYINSIKNQFKPLSYVLIPNCVLNRNFRNAQLP